MTLRELVKPGRLINYARRNGYRIFDSTTNYNLNIWAVRANNQEAGRFDDIQVVFWKDGLGWEYEVFNCTTDPSDHYLLNPINPRGTAIVKPGQWRGLWELGYHRSNHNHPALIQKEPIVVIRDFNKDIILDYYTPGNLGAFEKDVIRNDAHGYTMRWKDQFGNIVYKEDKGYFGINNHRAALGYIAKKIGLYSAGCIVQNDTKKYNEVFIPLIKRAIHNWGNSFSFTLVTQKSVEYEATR